ncbi:hypothetical protein ACP275_11G038500 [Erythranthe tilingii]
MAGMLPGVESARRRRFHNSSNLTSHEPSSTTYSTWRSYTTTTTTTHHFHSNSSTTRSSLIRQQGLYDDDDSRLSAAAIQAKKRLDQRLQLPHTHRSMNIDHEQERPTRSSINNRPPTPTNIHRLNLQDDDNQVPNKLKKSGSKRLNWLKLSWKSSEQDECAVCLEQFIKAEGGKSGGTLMQVPCGHRFHTNCLMPWLEANAHCPCCRMEIPSSK